MNNPSTEEILPSVFIIKKNQNSLRQAETYLKHRNWDIRTAFDIKQALVGILKQPPKYIIISVEHPHPKVMLLPKIMAQALKCVVIPYAESNSPLVLSKLNEVNSEFVLFPPASGPAIERIIKRIILKENEAAQQKDKMIAKGGSFENKDNHTFISKGAAASDDEAIAIKGARDALAKMFADEGDSTTPGVLGHLETTPPTSHKVDLHIQKGVNGQTTGYLDNGSRQDSHSSSQQSSSAHQNYHDSNKKNDFPEYRPNHSNGSEDNSGTSNQSLSGQVLDTKKSAYLPKISMDQLSISVDTALSAATAEKNSILVEGSKQALEGVINVNEKENVKAVEVATNVSCIIVESTKYNGYLVVAMGSNRKIENSFMKVLKKHLFKFLKENGEQITDEDQLQLKLEPVEFQDWAIEHAEFLRKSIHNGNEVAMAFFPCSEIQIPLEGGNDKDMLTVDLKNLRGDLKMEFDIYIHMPINNKYVLFTPKGGVLYSRQKERLLKKGIQKMHLHKNSIQDVKKYTAQNYLNDKIQEFQSKDTKKKSS